MKSISVLLGIFLFALALSTSLYSFAADKNTSDTRSSVKIIGGSEASKNEYPFITALTSAYSTSIEPFCGGSYVGGRYVITAAHCVEDTVPESIDVWIGGHDINLPLEGTRVAVKEIYMHEQYDSFSFNKDIAVLELEQVVSGITPLSIMTPAIEATINEGDLFTIMGWGNLDANPDSGVYPDVLNETQVPLYNRAACESAYSSNGQTNITEFMLCAGYVQGGQDTCQGDSGGPIIYQFNGTWYQAGVVSFGDGCAMANAPGIYTRVPALNNWIAQKQEGVSYRQFQDAGFVEAQYNDIQVITISNLSSAPFSVSNAQIQNTVNLTNTAIVENQCAGLLLTLNASCDISVQTIVNSLGSAGFTLVATTNSALGTPIEVNASLDAISASVLDMPTLIGSNNQYATWYSGGDSVWEAEYSRVSDGNSAVSSGDISDFEASVLLAKITDPHVKGLNFDYLVSSESGYDFFSVSLNGELLLADSGSSDTTFTQSGVSFSENINRVVFSFDKDESVSRGDDGAYIDAIAFTIGNENPSVVLASSNVSIEEGSVFALDASASSDPEQDALSYQWEIIGGVSANIALPTAAVTNVTAPAYDSASSFSVRVTVSDDLGGSAQGIVSVSVTQSPSNVVSNPSAGTSSGGGAFGMWPLLGIFIVWCRKPKRKMVVSA